MSEQAIARLQAQIMALMRENQTLKNRMTAAERRITEMTAAPPAPRKVDLADWQRNTPGNAERALAVDPRPEPAKRKPGRPRGSKNKAPLVVPDGVADLAE